MANRFLIRSTIYVILTMILVRPASSQSEIIQVPLTNKFGPEGKISFWKPAFGKDSIQKYKTAKSNRVNFSELRLTTMFNGQELRERLLKRRINKDQYDNYVQRYQVDTNFTAPIVIRKNKFASLIQLDADGNKFVTVDANNNMDLTDDSTYVLESGMKTVRHQVRISTEYYDAGEIKSVIVPMLLEMVPDVAEPTEISFLNQNYKEGIFELSGWRYSLTIATENYSLFGTRNFSYSIRPIDSDGATDNEIETYPAKTDILLHNQKLYHVNFDNPDTAKIIEVGTSVHSRAAVGTQAPTFIGRDMLNQRHLSSRDHVGKYILLDFWGTWCQPCLQSMPEIIKLVNMSDSSRFQVIGVAVEQKSDLSNFQAFLKRNKIDWPQILQVMRLDEVIVQDYNIQQFPTYVLVDPKGIVQVRASGADGLRRVREFLALKKVF